MSRTPGVGCGAVLMKDGAILLIQRLTAPEAGCWSLPGGKVDWGELAAQSAAREIEEELGVTVQGLDLLCVVDLIEEHAHWVSPVYLARSFVGEPKLLEPHKHGALGWFSLEALPSPLAASAKIAAEALAAR